MVKITRNVFGTVVFHYDIVGYVVYARYWPSPLRMVQSLQAQMALTQSEPMLGRSRTSRSSYLTVEFAHSHLIVLFF